MEGHLLMSSKERFRHFVFSEVKSGRLSLLAASVRVDLSYRQCKRVYKRFREEGDVGLVHRSRGRGSNRSKSSDIKARAISMYREQLDGFGPTLAAEKLAAAGLEVDHETLRRWLLASGDWKRRRRRKGHRLRREPRHHFGELVQLDGSHHRWFGPAGEQCCLVNMVDDATGLTMSLMAQEETTADCMKQLWQWIDNFGIPQALYVDRKSVFVTNREPTLEEQLGGITPKTAFGRACEKLDIDIIEANSPQAKGRVERNHAVYQDRFVKELSLLDVKTIEGANEVLAGGFVDGLNDKFCREPAKEQDYHRPVPKGMNLADVFCFEETRTVQNDWVVRHDNNHYQIQPDSKPLPKPGDKVVIRRRLDGSTELLYKIKPLKYMKLTHAAISERKKKKDIAPPTKGNVIPLKKAKASKSPWRQNVTLMFAESPGKNK
jgi:hypothetical protein